MNPKPERTEELTDAEKDALFDRLDDDPNLIVGVVNLMIAARWGPFATAETTRAYFKSLGIDERPPCIDPEGVLRVIDADNLHRFAEPIAEIARSPAGKSFFQRLGRKLAEGRGRAEGLDKADSFILHYWAHTPPGDHGHPALSFPLRDWSPQSAISLILHRTGIELTEEAYSQRRKRLGLHAPKQKIVRGELLKIGGVWEIGTLRVTKSVRTSRPDCE